MRLNRLYLITAIAAASSLSAFADDTGVYVLGSVGSSQPDIGQSTFDGRLGNAGATNVESSWQNSDWGWKAQLGYQFNRNFALEGGYVNLGDVSYNASYTQGTATGDYRVDGWNVAGLGILPLDNNFSMFGKLGVMDARVTTDLFGTGLGGVGNANDAVTTWRPEYGFGAMYNLTRNAGLRLEFEQINGVGNSSTTGQTNVDLMSLGATYRF
jgi:OOP family OmpA-OmpF porin